MKSRNQVSIFLNEKKITCYPKNVFENKLHRGAEAYTNLQTEQYRRDIAQYRIILL